MAMKQCVRACVCVCLTEIKIARIYLNILLSFTLFIISTDCAYPLVHPKINKKVHANNFKIYIICRPNLLKIKTEYI